MTDEQIHQLFKAVDRADKTALIKAFDEDIVLIFGNQDPVEGRDSVVETFGSTSANFDAIHHDIHAIWTGSWELGGVRSVECTANYTKKDGNTVSMPVTSTLRFNEKDLVAKYQIFMNASPAFA